MLGESRNTLVDNTRIAWTERGSGHPVILLHGLADSHRTWRRVVDLLSREHRVLMLDLPGHGLSGRPDAPYTLSWYADMVAGWMDAVGLERAHVCGHSFGGGVAQWMVLHHSPRIDRLALVAAGGLGKEVATGLRVATLPGVSALVGSSLFGPMTRFAMRSQSAFAALEREEVERLARLNSAANAGTAFRRTVASCIDLRGQYMQTWHHVQKVASLPPIALFWGSLDPVIPVAHAHQAQARLEHVALSSYPCGHFPQLEAAASFARDLSFFLADQQRPAAQLRSPVRADERRTGLGAPIARLLGLARVRTQEVRSQRTGRTSCADSPRFASV